MLKLIYVTILLFIGMNSIKAQEAIPASGGEASGGGGSSSFTVGQTVYTSYTGTNGNNVIEGVQQPYEISVVTSIPKARNININISTFPNPASDYLTVRVENYETENLQFMFFDLNGKLLRAVKAAGQETKIEISNFVPASYFVKVLDKQKEIKIFKIIKK
jgi:hypothetical protein